MKFTKERLILATEGHKLDSENEAPQRGAEQWTKTETPEKSLVGRSNEARLQVNKCTQRLFTSPCDGKSRVGEAAVLFAVPVPLCCHRLRPNSESASFEVRS